MALTVRCSSSSGIRKRSTSSLTAVSMSVAPLALTAIVKEGVGGLRKCHQAGVRPTDFVSYQEEYEWVLDRIADGAPVNPRVFRRKFPHFEWLPPDEPLVELLKDLREERAFTDM